jgi:hypothetical protein
MFRRTAAAFPVAAILIAAGATASAVPVPAADRVALARAAEASPASALPVSQRQVERWKLNKRELGEIAQARRWAATPKSRSVVRCESGFDYRLIDRQYHGAWQFLNSTWLGAGGGRYARSADRAPKFAQDHIAWKLWKRSGWGPWSCA